MTDACIVFSTCGSEDTALAIAKALVDQKLAACVSIIPGIKSYYWFEGRSHLNAEYKLIIKTRPGLFDRVSGLITELHPYKIPEIVMTKIDAASGPYLQWIEQTVIGP